VVAALWEPLLAGVLMIALVFCAGCVVTAVLVWRYCRRKWRAFHSHGLVVGAVALWQATSSGRFTRGPSSEDPGQWTARKLRRELWRAVDRADAAVREASRAGAPTASLPELCGRLHQVSIGLDRVLRVEQAGPVPGEVASQAIEVMRAASDVQQAAVASASDANGQRVSNLVRDARQEIQCLDAGLASAADVMPHPDR
jgi:hypothetical protein